MVATLAAALPPPPEGREEEKVKSSSRNSEGMHCREKGAAPLSWWMDLEKGGLLYTLCRMQGSNKLGTSLCTFCLTNQMSA